jgi:hypothetical protein
MTSDTDQGTSKTNRTHQRHMDDKYKIRARNFNKSTSNQKVPSNPTIRRSLLILIDPAVLTSNQIGTFYEFGSLHR